MIDDCHYVAAELYNNALKKCRKYKDSIFNIIKSCDNSPNYDVGDISHDLKRLINLLENFDVFDLNGEYCDKR